MKTFTKLLLAATLFINSSSLIAQTENVPATKNVRNITAISDLSIKGDKLFCTTSNIYTIENLPKGATVHWKVSPKGIAAITSPYSHQTTLNKISDGNVTLTAVVTYTSESATLKKRVTVGNPFPKGALHVSSNTIDATYTLQAGYTYFMSSTSDYSRTAFIINDNRYSAFAWTPVSLPPPSSGIIWGGNASVLQINFGAPQTSGSYSAVIQMQATGPCGLYTQNFSVTNILTQQPSSDFSVYPNPASQSGTLEISRNKIDFERLIYAIKIIDRFGVQRRMVEFKNGISSVKIPLGDLNPGLYTLSVFDGKNWNSKQLLIQK